MKIKAYEQTNERRVLIGLITSKQLLARLAHVWDKSGHFSSKWANTLAGWCFDYFHKYSTPPNRDITTILTDWASQRGGRSSDEIQPLERLIGDLNDEYTCSDELNVDYLVDCAAKIFNQNKLKKLVESLQDDIDNDELDKAQERLDTHSRIEVGMSSTVDVFHDIESACAFTEEVRESIIPCSGGLHRFFGRSLCRDGFIAFSGREKVGKSYWLLEMAYRAVRARKRVAMFQIGDMSLHQVEERIVARVLRRPIDAEKIKWPVKMTREFAERSKWVSGVKVEHEEREWEEQVTPHDIREGFERMRYRHIRSEKSYFKLQVHTAGFTMKELEGVLSDWSRRDGWIPDVIVIDYADLMGAPYKEERDRINSVWTELRALSQRLHCLVITGTQIKGEGYRKRTLDMGDYSGDKRKNAHVTGMIGINCDDGDKEYDVYRLNWLHRRGERFHPNHFCFTAACLAVANPAVLSVM